MQILSEVTLPMKNSNSAYLFVIIYNFDPAPYINDNIENKNALNFVHDRK